MHIVHGTFKKNQGTLKKIEGTTDIIQGTVDIIQGTLDTISGKLPSNWRSGAVPLWAPRSDETHINADSPTGAQYKQNLEPNHQRQFSLLSETPTQKHQHQDNSGNI
jgi:hypothetical protein